MSDKYKICPKCKLRHSALVRHKCAKPKKQDAPPEFEATEHDLEMGGPTTSLDKHEGKSDGEGGEGENEGEEGKGQGEDGEGQGQGAGEGSEGEGEGEGDGDGGEGQGGEGPAPQPPEPDAPPVAIVCTVLKFAALTAQCAKNGVIEVSVAEEGLFIYGHNGDEIAFDVLPWGEFEKRSTLDGEFYVKELIDGVDERLTEPSETPPTSFYHHVPAQSARQTNNEAKANGHREDGLPNPTEEGNVRRRKGL